MQNVIHSVGLGVARQGSRLCCSHPVAADWESGVPPCSKCPTAPGVLPGSGHSNACPTSHRAARGGLWEGSGLCCQCQYFYKKMELFYSNCGILLSKESMEKITWAHRLKSKTFIQISDHFFYYFFFFSAEENILYWGDSLVPTC